jgi:lipid II:glycine glycyltransferase (peptidoglycan interpeptide bridge formation enzyme)
MALTVRTISSAQHSEWLDGALASDQPPFVSFLQLPQWGSVKVGWRPESIGWFADSELVGVALVLYRGVPKLPQRSLAYLPEGPVIDWSGTKLPAFTLADWITPMVAHLRGAGAFAIKMGPPVAVRRWEAATIKSAIADGTSPARISTLTPDWSAPDGARVASALTSLGFSQELSTGAGFGDVQPRYVFQLPLADRSLDDIFAGFNQQWRRNIRKAEKAGVIITHGTRADLPAFHEVYVETAARDHFTPRGLAYFERMWDASVGLTLHLAHVDGHLAAATLMARVGTHAWYSYGASTTADRDAKPSNALQWDMIKTAYESGCRTYDMRGISDTLDSSNHLFGLVQFKLGSGGYAQEYVGEWDLDVRRVWARAYRTYASRGK